jgi:uncharacterized protein YgiM (DUF1202 family)
VVVCYIGGDKMSQESEASTNTDAIKQLRRCRVIIEYQTFYADPISVNAGETIKISEKVDYWNDNPDWVWVWCTDPRGKSGWVPRDYIEFGADGTTGVARYNYTARELSVTIGDVLTIEREGSGWLWCTNQQGRSGWVPEDHVAG